MVGAYKALELNLSMVCSCIQLIPWINDKDLVMWPCFSVLAFLRLIILITPLTTLIKYLTEATLSLYFFREDRVHYGVKTWWRDSKVAGHIASIAGSREIWVLQLIWFFPLFSFYIKFRIPSHDMKPPTLWTYLPFLTKSLWNYLHRTRSPNCGPLFSLETVGHWPGG